MWRPILFVLLKSEPDAKKTAALLGWLQMMGFNVQTHHNEEATVLELTGDNASLDVAMLRALDIVAEVRPDWVGEKPAPPYSQPDGIVAAGGVKFGGGDLQLIAGPCAVESWRQLSCIAQSVKAAGATLLRGGAFKPRTSPYAFQGLAKEGIKLLLAAKELTGLPVVSEITELSQLPLFENIDVIQVGARNMQNFELLKELGRVGKPILLKRGAANTIKELLLSAEYILAGGNEQVILCERGIRTFESYTKNTLDLSAVPALKALSPLPVLVDPSHGTGRAALVTPLALAAVAAGADGLLIEVHNSPECALCDGEQAITPDEFRSLAHSARDIWPYRYRY